MKPYYQDKYVPIYHGDCREILPELPDNTVDLLVTDPPYGIGFMGKDWDRALPDKRIWEECLRILKPSSFAFVMSIPRADCLSRMIISLEDAGFRVDFTPIFWAYATGFPKAQNIGKAVDKKAYRVNYSLNELQDKLNEKRKAKGLTLKSINELLGAPLDSGLAAHKFCDKSQPQFPTREQMMILDEALELGGELWTLYDKVEREIIGSKKAGLGSGKTYAFADNTEAPKEVDITLPYLDQAKALDGSYGGFQPKPAVEVILVAMKPLSEKTFVDQALKNRKGITWLDDCRIPYEEGGPTGVYGTSNATCSPTFNASPTKHEFKSAPHFSGRFPANLIVSNDVLNDGREHKTGDLFGSYKHGGGKIDYGEYGFSDHGHKADSGSFSRYFDLDKWAQKTFPFLIVPKASKREKNEGLGEMPEVVKSALPLRDGSGDYVKNEYGDGSQSTRRTRTKNYHPTVKPLKLMSYLITLGSRAGDTVLDPFLGSGTTALACQLLNRKCIGIEIEEKYCEIAANRCTQGVFNLRNRLPI